MQNVTQAAPSRININEHMGLAESVIRRHGYDAPAFRGCLEMEDLRQEAAIGLLRASQTFDPKCGQWSTHAWWYIRARVHRAIGNHAHVVRTPVYRQAERRRTGQRANECVQSLDAPVGHAGSDRTLHDVLADDGGAAEGAGIIACMLSRLVSLARLTEREQLVITRRYFDEETLETIAADMRVSRERVNQLEGQAMVKLKRAARRAGYAGDKESVSAQVGPAAESANMVARESTGPGIRALVRATPLTCLTEREQYVIKRRFLDEQKLRAIAGELNVSSVRVLQIQQRAVGKLKRVAMPGSVPGGEVAGG